MFAFAVTNTGNVTVASITVVDDRLAQQNITVTCTPTSLAPTQVSHCVANAPYVITQPDADAKKVVNTAHSTGKDPDGGPVRSNDDSTETPIEPFRIPLKVEKVGEASANTWVIMDGSSFAVLADANGEPGAALPFTIDDVETGLFQIDSIPAGTYWLSEVTAPDGFSLLADPVKFIINADRTVSVTGGGDQAVTATGQIITVRDVPAMTLPTTGGTGPLPYILAGSLTVLGAGGLALWMRRRSTRAETEDPQI
jgi:LPXTG-motif cell wall-anchored protein